MKLFPIIALALVATVIGFAAGSTNPIRPTQTSSAPSRYRLVPATVDTSGGTSQAIFKMDEVTGATWIYYIGQAGPKFAQGWVSIGVLEVAPSGPLAPTVVPAGK